MSVSILVPWRKDPAAPSRGKAWKWLEARWRAVMPEAELVTGSDVGFPFSKTVAVNDAFQKSQGDVLVIADADSWVERPSLVKAISYALSHGCLVIPWSKAHRLRKTDSQTIMRLDPATENPVSLDMRKQVEDYRPSPSTAAMVIVITREGFERVGGMDPRFRGWGAEDVAFGLACGTLLGESKMMLGEAFALFHERPRLEESNARVWDRDDGAHNVALGDRYWAAAGFPQKMAALCAEHPLEGVSRPIEASPRALSHPTHLTLVPREQLNEMRERFGDVFREGDTVRI